ncbi:MAG: LysR family transcriptional regulator [Acetobacteraceae bacterium]|nr:LysR family transcriptional regulator [Acetobacteraceae bacterium]
MEIRDLKYLAAAVTAGNFGRAAKSLGVETSTISRHIGRLEDELGLALFERANTGVHLTPGGKAVMVHVNRALAEFEAVGRSASRNGTGHAGEIRLGVRMPPVGEPLGSLLARWHVRHPNVVLTIVEMNEPSMAMALENRHLDVGIVTSFTPCANSEALPLYRERLTAALPVNHALAERDAVEWDDLRDETILIQEWDDSQATRELYSSLLGQSVRFSAHPASKQSVFALVAAGFGVTLATASQAEVTVPGVIFRPIAEANACLQIELVWRPELEDAAVGRFVAYLRDETQSRRLR